MTRTGIEHCKRIVVKVGSSLLGEEKAENINPLVDQIADLHTDNRETAIVTSGAIHFGLETLGETEYPETLPRKQATAAIGQTRLMNFYESFFSEHDLTTAQVLLTQQGIHNRETYLNASNTLHTLLDMGTVPIINENDTEATDEIQFGDNDTLAALVTTLIDADLLIILTDVEGLYRREDDGYGELVSEVEEIDETVKQWASSDTDSTATVGGMRTKIEAAEKITQAGTPMVVASGLEENVLTNILRGESTGTYFKPRTGQRVIQGRKRWIGYHLPVKGSIYVDDGAGEALRERGTSLLPSGVTQTDGQFGRGDAISVHNADGEEFARGLSNYKSDEVQALKGCHTSEISDILGYHDYDEIIHRDNLVVFPDDDNND